MKTRNRFFRLLLESVLSICPILLAIVVLSLVGIAPLGGYDYLLLGITGVLLILGLSVFSLGSDQSLVKVGELMGASLSKQSHLIIVIVVALLLGALVTCAEPSIMLLASQTPIPSWMLTLFISLGVGIFVSLGVVRIIFHRSLKIWLLTLYGLVFALICLIDQTSYIPLIFDAGGATTGSATVPFLLALGTGVATIRGGDKAKENSFGLIAIASVGPLIALTLLVIFYSSGLSDYVVAQVTMNDPNIIGKYLNELFITFGPNGGVSSFGVLIQVGMALLPILVIFYIYQAIYIHLPKRQLLSIFFGFLNTYIGLSLFLMAVQAAMMPIGLYAGQKLGNYGAFIAILVCFLIGLVTILCEPAIHVLTKQVESISDGGISKTSVLLTLSLGVGVAIALCAVRAYFNFPIIYYLVPGYIIALALSFFCPPLYVGLAFDSGGVASGPMTTSFVLPLVIGLTLSFNGGDASQIMGRSFGVIGMVALTPIIALQILGIAEKLKKERRLAALSTTKLTMADSEIIHF